MSVVKNCSWYQVDSRYCFQKYKSVLGKRKKIKPKHVNMPFLNVCVKVWTLDRLMALFSTCFQTDIISCLYSHSSERLIPIYILPYLINIRLSFGSFGMAFLLSNLYFNQEYFIYLIMLVLYCQIVLAVKWYFANSKRLMTATRCYFSSTKLTPDSLQSFNMRSLFLYKCVWWSIK